MYPCFGPSKLFRSELSEKGIVHARRYSWERTAQLTWDAYEMAARPQAGGSRP